MAQPTAQTDRDLTSISEARSLARRATTRSTARSQSSGERMSRFRRPAATILAVATFWPTLVFGQAPKAGVVTTLEGNVTVTRVALPQPQPLKFKDDVFVNDKVTTGDKAIARMLLGGKAVVTVRERSRLTISEVPGKRWPASAAPWWSRRSRAPRPKPAAPSARPGRSGS